MMMRRRRGRPGLLGTMTRTAVVAGTATATAGAVRGHQEQKAAQQEAAAEQQQAAAAPPAPAAPAADAAPTTAAAGSTSGTVAGLSDETIDKLKQLGELKDQGVLSDDEFAAAKAKLLGM